MDFTRREAVAALAAGSSAAFTLSGGIPMARANDTPGSTGGRQLSPGTHRVVPLPFDPTKLRGLSERLLVSHHENNYAGALANLNKVEGELSRVTKDTPGFVVAGLRDRELLFTNSAILHEFYFANLGGDGKPGGEIEKALREGFGDFGRWEELFRATGLSLAGGSGWAILDFNFHTGDLRTYGSGNHTQSLAWGAPLLVMDMYEHAYHLDYGAAAARYIDAFFANIQWDEVNRRLERARRAHGALHAGTAPVG